MCHWGCNDLKTKVIFPYYSLIFVTTLLTNGQYLLSLNLQRSLSDAYVVKTSSKIRRKVSDNDLTLLSVV